MDGFKPPEAAVVTRNCTRRLKKLRSYFKTLVQFVFTSLIENRVKATYG